MFVYFSRTYTVSVSGSKTKRVRCVGCSYAFEFDITREAWGRGHSAYYLNNIGAAESAKRRASENLKRALDEETDPVSCPRCGIFQPDMVRVLREQRGKRYDPNKYAALRKAHLPCDAWRVARETNTVQAYRRFMDIWPTFDDLAKEEIEKLRYPPRLRKLVSYFFGLVAALIVLSLLGGLNYREPSSRDRAAGHGDTHPGR